MLWKKSTLYVPGTSSLLSSHLQKREYGEEDCMQVIGGKVKGKETLGIIGPKKDDEIGGLRGLHKEQLHNLCSSPRII
jgi:hypothetical protein